MENQSKYLSESAIDLMNKFGQDLDNLPLDYKNYDEDYLFLELIEEEDNYYGPKEEGY